MPLDLSPISVTYNGGPLITNAQIFVIFLGSQWQTPPFPQTAATIANFCGTFITGAVIAQLAEYSQPNQTIALGTMAGSRLLPVVVPNLISDDFVRSSLTAAAANGEIPLGTSQTIYLVFICDGVTIDVPYPVGRSCVNHCGYHSNIEGTAYAVLPFPSCAACQKPGLQILDVLTVSTSHEICEAITNPLGNGWFAMVNGSVAEIGDLCVGQIKRMGPYYVQQIWSRTQNGCL